MAKEIADGLRHDLKLVTCPKVTCPERSDRTSCYLEGHSNCRFFSSHRAAFGEGGVTHRKQIRISEC